MGRTGGRGEGNTVVFSELHAGTGFTNSALHMTRRLERKQDFLCCLLVQLCSKHSLRYVVVAVLMAMAGPLTCMCCLDADEPSVPDIVRLYSHLVSV